MMGAAAQGGGKRSNRVGKCAAHRGGACRWADGEAAGSPPSDASWIILLGGRVALERMIVCRVVVAGFVQLWLALGHMAEHLQALPSVFAYSGLAGRPSPVM